MPRSKKTTVTEETDENPQEVDYNKDIKGKAMADVATTEDKTPAKEDKPAETALDTPVTPTETAPPEPVAPAFDAEAFKKETAQQVKNEIADFLKGDKTEPESNVSKWEKYRQDYIQTHGGNNPDWEVMSEFIKETAKSEWNAEIQQQMNANVETQKQQAQYNQQQLDAFNKELEEELGELYANNKLPKVKNAEDPTDYGIVARQALYQTMSDVNVKRVSEGKAPIRSIARIHSLYYKAPNRQPAGADVIVGGSNAATSGANDEGELDYVKDVRGGFKGMYNRIMRR